MRDSRRVITMCWPGRDGRASVARRASCGLLAMVVVVDGVCEHFRDRFVSSPRVPKRLARNEGIKMWKLGICIKDGVFTVS